MNTTFLLFAMQMAKTWMAYLDPGTGSILWQMLAAALLGGGFAIKVYWKKIKRLFTRKGSEITGVNPGEEDNTHPDEPQQPL